MYSFYLYHCHLLFHHSSPSGQVRAILIGIIAEMVGGILASKVSETPADINLPCK